MGSQVARSSSDTARLLLGAPSYAVGWQEPVYVTQPAAGADWSVAGDGRFFTRLVAARWNFTASATVATRFTEFQLKDTNGVIISEVPAGQGMVASTSVQPSLFVGCPVQGSAAQFQTPGFIPDILIPPGWSWGTVTSGLQAGDQFSSIVLLVQRFPNDAASQPAEY